MFSDAQLHRPSLYPLTAATPNFISDIFYLTIAMSHYGYLKTIQSYTNLSKHIDDLQRHSEMLNGDGSWMGVSWHFDMES